MEGHRADNIDSAECSVVTVLSAMKNLGVVGVYRFCPFDSNNPGKRAQTNAHQDARQQAEASAGQHTLEGIGPKK